MNILIAGATGLIGTALVQRLKSDHRITVLGRDSNLLATHFSEDITRCSWDNLEQLQARTFDAVINLCGYNIAQSRWDSSVKKKLIDSRVHTNKTLIAWLMHQGAKPHYISANAVGIYGLQNNGDPSALDETTPINFEQPIDFMSKIGVAWQQSVLPAMDFGMPVTITRFGVVLKKDDGMLKKLVLPFSLGLGSTLGDGKQVLSWIHIDDLINAYVFLLQHPELTGAFNVTSPNPTNQETFAKTLAHTLNRPLFLKMPGWFIKLLLGEMGECLLLKGQRVLPKRLLDAGFQFQYPRLEEALNALLVEAKP